MCPLLFRSGRCRSKLSLEILPRLPLIPSPLLAIACGASRRLGKPKHPPMDLKSHGCSTGACAKQVVQTDDQKRRRRERAAVRKVNKGVARCEVLTPRPTSAHTRVRVNISNQRPTPHHLDIKPILTRSFLIHGLFILAHTHHTCPNL